MTALELTRSRDDRRLYEMPRVEALRFGGLLSRRAAAEAGGTVWSFQRVGSWRTTIQASDAGGAVVGVFSLRRGGALRWEGREFVLRSARAWRERYALIEHGLELALLVYIRYDCLSGNLPISDHKRCI
jgi:hypothetical protein